MSTDSPTAEAYAVACLHSVAQAHPDAVQLARYASLATRLDASLLRRLRLAMAPGLHAGAEADLWFSDLAESRDSESLVLQPAIAALLRVQLADEHMPDGASALDLAYAHTQAMHAAWPASLQLEEALLYLALRHGPQAADQIDELLRPAIVAMASQPQRGIEISRWVVRALPNLPDVVRRSETARTLMLAAVAILGTEHELLASVVPGPLPADLGWLLPDNTLVEHTRLLCELRGPVLMFQAAGPAADDAQCITLAQTRPLLVELRTMDGQQVSTRLLALTLGAPVPLPAAWQSIELRGLDGRAWSVERLQPPPPPPMPPQDFKHDIFVSYRRSASPEGERWVDEFCNSLQLALRDRVGDVTMWRDTSELRSGNDWRLETREAIRQARLAVCIVSRTYFDSDECRREFDEILDPRNRLTLPDPHQRLFIVMRHPLKPDHGGALDVVAALPRYEFFETRDGQWVELENRKSDDYHERLGRLIFDIMVALERLKQVPPIPTAPKATVYLAVCAPGLAAQHELLRSALLQHGYHVLPERAPLTNVDDWPSKVQTGLAESVLSVHLVGPEPAPVPPSTGGRPVDVIQHELAVEQGRRSGLQRVIWIQGHYGNVDPQQQRFFQAIEESVNDKLSEYWDGSFEDFKSMVLDSLSRRQRPASLPLGQSDAYRE